MMLIFPFTITMLRTERSSIKSKYLEYLSILETIAPTGSTIGLDFARGRIHCFSSGLDISLQSCMTMNHEENLIQYPVLFSNLQAKLP